MIIKEQPITEIERIRPAEDLEEFNYEAIEHNQPDYDSYPKTPFEQWLIENFSLRHGDETSGTNIERINLGEVSNYKTYEQWKIDWEKGFDYLASIFKTRNWREIQRLAIEENFDIDLSDKHLFEIVKKRQPEGSSPTNPPTAFSTRLRSVLCEDLGLAENSENLVFYTSVGNMIDYHGDYKIDAFFEFIDNDGEVIRITLNGKSYIYKENESSFLADVAITYPNYYLDINSNSNKNPERLARARKEWDDCIQQAETAILNAINTKIKAKQK